MNAHATRHSKIRFRRRDIAVLDGMPSALDDAPAPPAGGGGRFLRVVLWSIGGLALVIVALALAAGLALNAGYGVAQLDRAADSQLSALFGRPVDASFSRPRISMDSVGAFAIEAADASVVEPGGAPVAHARKLRFVVSLTALLRGRLALSGASAEGARIDVGALAPAAAPESSLWATLADPDALAKSAFATVSALLAGLERAGADRVGLDDVELAWGDGVAKRLGIVSLDARRSGRALKIDASLERDGKPISVEAVAGIDAAGKVAELALAADLPAIGGPADKLRIGPAHLAMKGSQANGDAIAFDLDPVDVSIVSGSETFDWRVAAKAELIEGSGKLEFNEVTAVSGATRLAFTGAMSPVTPSETERAFRYELVSDKSVSAPADSSEPPLEFSARIAGRWTPAAGLLTAEQFGVRTLQGEVMGTASLTFADERAPATYLAVRVEEGLPVGHAKQLWPAGAAPSARHWTLQNLFGGKLTAGFLEMKLGPGRLPEGKYGNDEISGHFAVSGARFDVAGDMPPVRDANGTIDFSGDDVRITLESGAAFMPSGRSVATRGGALVIADAAVSPVVGKLDIAVAGDADAVLELSGYKPINALDNLPLKPEELSGKVEGRVVADIPLSTQRADKPSFDVALDFTDLAVAREFDGQKVTEADGDIVVTPQNATIRTKAKLNGIPAELTLVEPLKKDGEGRSQNIVLLIDEKTQKAKAPGLSEIVDGPFSIELSKSGEGKRFAKADLGKARIDLPWVGWSKGAGIPATADFAVDTIKDGVMRITGFRLTGKSFAIEGDMAVRSDGLVSADFKRVKLNAADQAAVAIKRAGAGYQVQLTGKSLDGRALIKQVLSDPVEAGSTIGATPVRLAAKIDSVLGFGDETLNGLSIDYDGTGKMVGNLKIAATTAGGGDVSIVNAAKGEKREVRMASSDAGALLRFLDIYDKMRGGSISLALAGGLTGALKGDIDARDFKVVDEPRLRSLVSSRPSDAEKSLSETLDKKIDTSVVRFEQGFARITKGRGLLSVEKGILRGPLLGFTFQGTLYDDKNAMAMTGTMMPAYGLNRIFGELPLIGLILGNGEDKGLIGITFKLAGKASEPVLSVNPISLIAPGIFRSIFEFRKG